MWSTTKVFPLLFNFIFLFPVCALATIHPAEGAKLHQTQVMFEYEEVDNATSYLVTVFTLDDQGNKKTKSLTSKNNSLAVIISGLEFGSSYVWMYEAFKKNKKIYSSKEFHFSVQPLYLVDNNFFKSTIDISKKGGFNNEIIFLDYLGAAIDRQGKPVWYFPFVAEDGRSAPNFRNMRMTKQGTVTFQDNNDCFEVDLNGQTIWKAPNDGKISGAPREFYHHDFKKMDDGSYMTSSYKYVDETNLYNSSVTTKVRYNTLIQYDAAGNVLWSWNEKDFVPKEVLFYGYGDQSTEVEGTHLNGFDYNPTEDAFVMSFRNNSSILKIDKKTGSIIYDLGVYNLQSRKKRSDPWFARQHGPVILPDHQILIYNNNVLEEAGKTPTYPKILIVKEPMNELPAEKLWEFECRSDRYPNGITGKEGYAIQLPNKNILVSMGGANYAFEVNMQKEVVWQASFQKYDTDKKEWTPFNNYRVNFSSSLYPKYFTLQHTAPGKKNTEVNSFRINNEGTDTDTYGIDVLSGPEKIYSDTISISPRSSFVVKIPGSKNDAPVTAYATSLSTPMFSKLIILKK